MSLFPNKDVTTKEIATWRGFIEKLCTEANKLVFTKLLNDCYKYSVAMNNHAQTNPFPTESLIMALLLTQHKVINHLKSMIKSKQIEDDGRLCNQ